jgi:Rod binding domain-containing protein
MTTPIPSLVTPQVDGASITANSVVAARLKAVRDTRTRSQAEDFEAQFLNSMFQEMYESVGGEGPFGNSQGVGPFRSFLTDEVAKNFVKRGGIGIADEVYKSLLAHQEAQAK